MLTNNKQDENTEHSFVWATRHISPKTKDFTLPPENKSQKYFFKFKAIFLSFFRGLKMFLKRTKFAHYTHKETRDIFILVGQEEQRKKRHNSRL